MKIQLLLAVHMLAACDLLMGDEATAGAIEVYRGTSRLILFSLPTDRCSKELNRILMMRREEIEERDLTLIDLSKGEHRFASALRLQPTQTDAIRRRFIAGSDEKHPVFILIGKDGGVKARSQDTLDLDQWFTLIDAMPMRRAEIRDSCNQP